MFVCDGCLRYFVFVLAAFEAGRGVLGILAMLVVLGYIFDMFAEFVFLEDVPPIQGIGWS